MVMIFQRTFQHSVHNGVVWCVFMCACMKECVHTSPYARVSVNSDLKLQNSSSNNNNVDCWGSSMLIFSWLNCFQKSNDWLKVSVKP